MEQEWELALFQPRDAAGVVALYREVYGESYPVAEVYDPKALVRQEEDGLTWRAVARNHAGAVIGHIAFYRSTPPNPKLYECGQLMVCHEWRQTSVGFALMEYALAEIPRQRGLEQIWGEAVCNHLFTQMMMTKRGYHETGLEVALMPGDAAKGGERTSTVLIFSSPGESGQTVYVPQVYQEAFALLYGELAEACNFVEATAPLPQAVATEGSIEMFAGAGVARLSITNIGADFEAKAALWESQASAAGTVVLQAFLRLGDETIGAAVEILRRRGYFLGGVLPGWYGGDGLLMQKVSIAVDEKAIHAYTKKAKAIKALVLKDWAEVCPQSWGGVLRLAAAKWPEKAAAVYPQKNRSYTYAQLDAEAAQVAKGLMALGMGRGEHAAIWAFNIPEYLSVQFGCARAGAPLVLLNTNYRAYELEYVLHHSDATVLFLEAQGSGAEAWLEVLRSVRERLPKLRKVVFFGAAEAEDVLLWPDFLAGGAAVEEEVYRQRCNEERSQDVFILQYTSGTTGVPKGVVHCQQAYLCNARAYGERQGLTTSSVLCSALPFFHAYGNAVILTALYYGGTLVGVERFQAPVVLRAIAEQGVTSLSGTPTMFVALLEEWERNSYDTSSLCVGDMAGASCPPELVQAVIEKLGATGFSCLYGSTEVIIASLAGPTRTQEERINHVGTALPGMELRIVKAGTMEEVPPGVEGELCVRGQSSMLRYYKMEEETQKAMDDGGWWHSGDMAQIDEVGCCHITGRIKDLIIRGGENIGPAEIETFLMTHPKVLEAQVVGVPSEYYGEDIVAFVRLQKGETAKVLELKRYCRERIALNKVPFMFFFVEEFPLTASGKVQKFKLRELALENLTKQ